MARQVYFLDLKSNDVAGEYDDFHRPGRVPAGVLADIRASGVKLMEIYRIGTRLVLISETPGDASPTDRVASQASREWEELMARRFQQPLAEAMPDEKWVEAAKIFDLSEHL